MNIKFHLINYRSNTTGRSFDQVVVGTIENAIQFAEAEAYNYNTDFYIEYSSFRWDNKLNEAFLNSHHNIVNLCNY